MLRILLLRPGATEYDQQGRIQGTLDIPLSEDGRQEVESLVNELRSQPLEAIYTSPCQSAQQTADSLGKAIQVNPKTVEKLQNLDHGLWQGMLVEDVKIKQPKVYRQWQDQPETICPPQGETVSEAEERIRSVITKLIKKHKAKGLIALVVPEPLASVVSHVLRKDALGDLWNSTSEAAHWDIIELQPESAV